MQNESTKHQLSESPSKPLFLKSVVEPLDDRVEMGKLPKMCKNSFYGN